MSVESLPTQRHPQTPPGTQEAPSLSHRETIGRVLGHLWRVFMGGGSASDTCEDHMTDHDPCDWPVGGGN